MSMVEHPIPRKDRLHRRNGVAGKAIAAAAVGTLKRVTLELGGQSPAIVCADADIDVAIESIARHAFSNSGQFCYRVNRIYVERPVYETFLAGLVRQDEDAEGRRPAVGGDARSGPLVNEKIFRNSERRSRMRSPKGARIALGGERLTGGSTTGAGSCPRRSSRRPIPRCWS